MRKQDTAALDTHALVARVGELGIKQYWLARKLEVTTRTVNRWMTGRVKRISRENLSRMVEVLKTTEEALTTPDEGDVFATRSEQTKAAQLLIQPETESLFQTTQQFAAYEQLLKATLHPDLTVSQLVIMYNQLLIANAMQHKFDEARLIGARAVEYAQRAGDVNHEISARASLAVIDAEQGLLGEARKKLELLADLLESIGAEARQQAHIQHNLLTAYRLQGEMRRAVQSANICLAYYCKHGRRDLCGAAYGSAAMLARDLGQYALALELMQTSNQIHLHGRLQREKSESALYLLELRSLAGEVAVADLLPPLLERLNQFTYIGDNYWVAAAGILRRAGRLSEARQAVEEGLARPSTRRYERPLLQQEMARIASAEGNKRSAGRLLEEANNDFRNFGMAKRVCDDPALEVGQQFKRSGARLRLSNPVSHYIVPAGDEKSPAR